MNILRNSFARLGVARHQMIKRCIPPNRQTFYVSSDSIRTMHHSCRTRKSQSVFQTLPKNIFNKLNPCIFHLSRSINTPVFGHKRRKKNNQNLDEDKYEDNKEIGQEKERLGIKKLFERLNNDYIVNLIETMADEGDIKMTSQDWHEIEKNIEEHFEKTSVFGKYWSTQIMAFFNNQLFINRAQSLLDFVTIDKAHLSVLKYYLDLCSKADYSDQQDDICRVYDALKPRTDMLDFDTTTVIITALCKTNRWRESVDLLKKAEKLENTTSQQFSAIIGAAIQAVDFEMVDNLLEKMNHVCLEPKAFVYSQFLRIDNVDNGYKMLKLMFKHMGQNAWYPNESIALEMKEWFETKCPGGKAWKAVLTDVSGKGVCIRCSHNLEKVNINDEDFNSLRDAFVEKSLIGRDVFINTTPDEMKEFQDFLEKNGPYDVVIDGLNVVHTSSRPYYGNLLSVVRECWARKKRSLVLTRAHAQKIQIFSQIQLKADAFFAKNLSSDDPFLVYAALYSGKNTKIISRDELRDHRFLLGEKMAQLFKVWQRSNQIVFHGIYQYGPKKGFPNLAIPPTHLVAPQECDNGWHIPYDDKSERRSFECPDTWLCIKEQNKSG